MTRPILALDFDGVLHSYESGWLGTDVVPDPPVAGAVEFVAAALGRFRVVVTSSRCELEAGREAIRGWLDRWGFPEGVEVVEHKPAAAVTLDDRALCFTGEWPDVEDLAWFRPWHALPLWPAGDAGGG